MARGRRPGSDARGSPALPGVAGERGSTRGSGVWPGFGWARPLTLALLSVASQDDNER